MVRENSRNIVKERDRRKEEKKELGPIWEREIKIIIR